MDSAQAIGIGASALLGYLVGSVNFAVIVARRHGVDILSAGSGNPGATNVKRVLGKGPGNLVFALDSLKGAAGAWFPALAAAWAMGVAPSFATQAAGFVGALLGHCFSCFLGFKGGKGVASTIGGLLVLLPIPVVIGAALWVVAFQATRYVSVASLVLGLSLPVSCWLLPQFTSLSHGATEFWFAAALAAFNVWTHRSNLARLLRGEESRFSRDKEEAR